MAKNAIPTRMTSAVPTPKVSFSPTFFNHTIKSIPTMIATMLYHTIVIISFLPEKLFAEDGFNVVYRSFHDFISTRMAVCQYIR